MFLHLKDVCMPASRTGAFLEQNDKSSRTNLQQEKHVTLQRSLLSCLLFKKYKYKGPNL